MPISPDRLRELAARGESPTLDFKEKMYDFAANRAAANAELAKDLMALANSLKVGSEPAYILIGVQDDGTIVGVPPASHVDDASLHQKVAGLLNRTPNFSYAIVDVDSMSVGVFEIHSGGRPYFPLKDVPPSLRKHVGMYRSGSSTEPASPTMVIEWSREDDPAGNRIKELELREREAEARVDGSIEIMTESRGGDGTSITLQVWNLGRRVFSVSMCRWRAEWNAKFFAELKKSLGHRPSGSYDEAWNEGRYPPSYAPPQGEFKIDSPGIVSPMRSMFRIVNFSWTRTDALAHIRNHQVPIDGFNGSWVTIHFEIPCRGELGTDAILQLSCR